MRKLTILFSSVCILSLCFSCSFEGKEKRVYEKMPKEVRMQALAEQEFEIARNTETNKISRKQVFKLSQQLQNGQVRSTENLKWEERGPNNFGGRTRGFAFDPSDPTGNTLWAGGVAGGLWRCTNAFADDYVWERVDTYNGNAAISSIVIDPSNHDVMYVSTGEGWFNADAYTGDGIYRSLDGGRSWNRLESTSDAIFEHVQKLLISGDRLFACTRAGGLQMSIDRGETWVKSLGNGQFGFSERAGDIDKASDGTLMACMGFGTTNDGVYKSVDNGDTWEYLPLPGSTFRRTELAISPSNPKVIYVLKEAESRSVEEIAKSTNGGVSWELLESPGAIGLTYFTRNQAWYDLSIAVDPKDENRVFIGGIDVLLTKDGGQTWEQISRWVRDEPIQFVHADQHSVHFLDDTGDKIAFTNDGGIFLTEEGQADVPTMEEKKFGYNTIQFYACAVHPTLTDWMLGGTQDNGTHLFTVDGMNSTERVTGGDGGYCHIDRDNPMIQMSAFTYNNYRVTMDAWNSTEFYGLPGRLGFFINPTDYDDVHDMLICSGNFGKINLLDIHAGTFDSLSFQQIEGTQVSAIKVHPNDPTKIYLGTNGGKVLRLDSLMQGSLNVTEIFSSTGLVRNIDIDFENPERLLICISNPNVPSIFISENDGETWENHDGDLPVIPIRWGVLDPSNGTGVILGTEVGVWSTDFVDGDNTSWSYTSNGLPATRVDMLDVRHSDNLLVAATHGRGMFTARICSGSVDNDNDGFTCDMDCDDFNSDVNAGQIEIPYNGVDDDCDPGTLDDDLDMDGYAFADDCDDTNDMVHPYAQEIEGNGIDENCDGLDEITPCNTVFTGPWSVFSDGGICFGGPISSSWSVWSNESYLISSLRDGISYYFDFCDGYTEDVFMARISVYQYDHASGSRGEMIISKDSCRVEFTHMNDEAFPDALILLHDQNDCSGISNMTGNGMATFGCLSTGIDEDEDGVTSELDCDDMNPNISPDLEEVAYNGIDDDCDASTPDDDLDGDGYLMAEDCDDLNSEVNPGQEEIFLNGIDDDCDPNTLDNDLDGDGWTIFEDCDETNPDINPGATEIPDNGIDEDCDGVDGTTATNELAGVEFEVFPNPTTGRVYIVSKGGLELKINIYSITGALQKTILDSSLIDISDLQSGTYLLEFNDMISGDRTVEQVVLVR